MKRLSLVLVVCLSLQLSVAAAPFIHLHADEAHETDHHEGALVHRHLAAHTTADDHHQTGAHTLEAQAADDASSVESSDAVVAVAIGAMSARLSAASASLGLPAAVADAPVPLEPPTPPDDDVGGRLASAPDLGTSSLRGPPR